MKIDYCFEERIPNEVYIFFEWNNGVVIDYILEEKILFIYNVHKKYVDMAKDYINSIGLEINHVIR